MTLQNFIKAYTYMGNSCLTIEGYCKEEYFEYYFLPPKKYKNFSRKNPKYRVPSCLERMPWWNEVKNRQVKYFAIITGLREYDFELCIELIENRSTE